MSAIDKQGPWTTALRANGAMEDVGASDGMAPPAGGSDVGSASVSMVR